MGFMISCPNGIFDMSFFTSSPLLDTFGSKLSSNVPWMVIYGDILAEIQDGRYHGSTRNPMGENVNQNQKELHLLIIAMFVLFALIRNSR
jgi:hypothetical protein